jgi:hypothetical protein
MTTEQAANFVVETITTAKNEILKNGISEPQTLFAICKKLSAMLNLDVDLIIDIMTKETAN